MSIYDELQQDKGIAAAVDEFYRRVTLDPQLAGYFQGVDMGRLRAHQAKLISQVTGGPVTYDGRSLAEAHAGLHISDADFDRVVEHLAGTLTDMGVADSTIAQIAAVLGAHRGDVVGDPAGLPG
ncbi:hemoglobin [Motilibacter rhizosphaerae]|uniref:Group 1 truncated hemoglobin n=1 Tax=Motilibacter rhizosphaerae TaxID=598652 RepID=A0A4Q7NG76_9ACTN|nr:group 1 truncated hemoglobin [Motilibacter rhizosphaerae]RZS82784.1 hemoglobin [Motilibacter rhizosphaerae]